MSNARDADAKTSHEHWAPPTQQETWNSENLELLVRADEVCEEFKRDHQGPHRCAQDEAAGAAPYPTGVITPKLVREYYRARGVDVSVTLKNRVFLVRPNHPQQNLGFSLTSVPE